MKVLVVKTSSLGDVIHTLPALTDARQAFPDIQFDWVLEKSFQSIPQWHPSVRSVLPIELRRWRKNLWDLATYREMFDRFSAIRSHPYDAIIDAQGLLKTAALSHIAKGRRLGFNKASIREPLASFFYQSTYAVPKNLHAIQRNRRLFAQALQYPLPDTLPDYGIDLAKLAPFSNEKPYYVFLHGTTWATKHWPESYWMQLAVQLEHQDTQTLLLWGNPTEKERAEKIAQQVGNAKVLPRLSLDEIGGVLMGAMGVVTVDTGLGHLACALNIPTISLYGPTDPNKSGILGPRQQSLTGHVSCAPCLKRTCQYSNSHNNIVEPPCLLDIKPEQVAHSLKLQIQSGTAQAS